METVFECSYAPTVRMTAHRIRKWNPVRCLILLLVGITLFLYILTMSIWCRFQGIWCFLFLVSIIELLYGLFFPEINAFLWLRRYKKDTDGEGIYKVLFGDHIEVWQGNIRVSWEYSEITMVEHLRYTYELKKNRRLCISVVPGGFTKGTFSEFKQFLRAKRPDLQIPD